MNMTAKQFARHFKALRSKRRKAVQEGKANGHGRARLTSAQRGSVLSKTGGRCHICGGKIEGQWQADHVLAHSAGGGHAEENFLPAHAVCNNYRWHYSAEEFQLILKLGVMVRTMVEKGIGPGPDIAEAFVRHERRRTGRTKSARAPSV
jgi:hypothetical protein